MLEHLRRGDDELLSPVALLYYTFLPRYLTTDLLSSVVDSSLPEGLVNEFVSTILTFMSITFHSTMFVALTLAIIFSSI